MELTHKDIKAIKTLVYKYTGIILNDSKDIMIKNRVHKLIEKHSLPHDMKYILERVSSGELREIFINSFTTNKTDLFREVFHFNDLLDRVFTEHFKYENSINIYCCASSTGEEPYSIATTFLHYKELMNAPINATITATDIDTNVLAQAKEGVFQVNKYQNPFPNWFKPQLYFKRRETQETIPYFFIKAKDEVKKLLTFKQLNLFDQTYPFKESSLDVIFCRNVLIYFNTKDQGAIIHKLLKILKMGGTIYFGHSENPLEYSRYLEKKGHNIFVKVKDIL
ncbi:MAG: protein-glutamate O-methyltransferase CheR [Campylobacterales bacterium]|nr:protein-glutamate O-methyltransferase CheR [Campylobacterales bacterium]